MDYPVNELVKEVRVILDENMISAALIAVNDNDTLTLNEIIESKIVDAARYIEGIAPRIMIDRAVSTTLPTQWSEGPAGKGKGIAALPDNFMRLISFKMPDWLTAATEAIDEEDPRYLIQQSRFEGVRGNPAKPVVAIVNSDSGLSLEFYTSNRSENATAKLIYLPFPVIANGTINICKKLQRAIVYYTAYLTALAVGEADKAKSFLETSSVLST